MPIIKSAIKRAKQSAVRRSRNLQVKRAIKQDVNELQAAIATGKAEEIQAKLSAVYSEVDRAVKKHTLHKNTAARRKSRLAHQIAKATGAEAVAPEAKTTKGAGTGAKKAAASKKPAAKKAAAAKKPVAKKPAAPKKAA